MSSFDYSTVNAHPSGVLQLAAKTGIPADVLYRFRPKLTDLDAIDDGGEGCGVCADEGAFIEVHWYGRNGDGEDMENGCCRGCLGRALIAADVDPDYPVEIAYLPVAD